MDSNNMDDGVIKIKEPPSLWKWYFGLHLRMFLSIPIFLLFVYQGLWFIWAEFRDIVFFFNHTEITWGSIFLVLIFGSILIWFFLLPIYICFCSIDWLYQVNIGNYSAWKKFFYSIGIILLVVFGADIIRLFTAWVLGILR